MSDRYLEPKQQKSLGIDLSENTLPDFCNLDTQGGFLHETLSLNLDYIMNLMASSVHKGLSAANFYTHPNQDNIKEQILNKELVDSSVLAYPNGPTVAFYSMGTPGIEFSMSLAASKDVDGVNFIMVPLVDGLVRAENGSGIYAKNAVICNSESGLQIVEFQKPLRVHAIDITGLSRSRMRDEIENLGIPVLNNSFAITLTDDKFSCWELLEKQNVAQPKTTFIGQTDSVEEAVENLIAELSTSRTPLVVKPNAGAFSQNVKMFLPDEIKEVKSYASSLLERVPAVLIQERITNDTWYDFELDSYIDSSVRVLATGKNGEPYTAENMVEIRYAPRSEKPVGVSAGAEAITMQQMFDQRGMSPSEQEIFYKGLEETVLVAHEALSKECKSSGSDAGVGLVGWDLMQDQSGKWNIIEVNAGNVGGITTLEKLAEDETRGLASIPVAEHLAALATTYHRNIEKSPQNASTFSDLADLDNWILLVTISETLRVHGETNLARLLDNRAIQLNPNNPRIRYSAALNEFTAKNYQIAEKHLLDGEALDPSINLENNLLGHIYRITDRLEDARVFFQRNADYSSRLSRPNADVNRMLSKIHELAQNPEKATTALANFRHQVGKLIGRESEDHTS